MAESHTFHDRQGCVVPDGVVFRQSGLANPGDRWPQMWALSPYQISSPPVHGSIVIHTDPAQRFCPNEVCRFHFTSRATPQRSRCSHASFNWFSFAGRMPARTWSAMFARVRIGAPITTYYVVRWIRPLHGSVTLGGVIRMVRSWLIDNLNRCSLSHL